jgi:hypothetical protein
MKRTSEQMSSLPNELGNGGVTGEEEMGIFIPNMLNVTTCGNEVTASTVCPKNNGHRRFEWGTPVRLSTTIGRS